MLVARIRSRRSYSTPVQRQPIVLKLNEFLAALADEPQARQRGGIAELDVDRRQPRALIKRLAHRRQRRLTLETGKLAPNFGGEKAERFDADCLRGELHGQGNLGDWWLRERDEVIKLPTLLWRHCPHFISFLC